MPVLHALEEALALLLRVPVQVEHRRPLTLRTFNPVHEWTKQMECSTSVCKVEALFQVSLAGFSGLNWYERVVTNQLTVLICCSFSDRISFGPFNETERILRDELDPLKEKFQIASA